ncbi:MAG: TIGR00730 family Rossman fold protein [Aquabacterium sp.]|nr:MAG: TIGR00730 family Rossman fold protein [Aquabacterium sp.]
MNATAPSKLSVCVYCGSRAGRLDSYAQAARRTGEEIARRGWRLVYGGGKVGLMGEVADAVIAGGADAIGVIPQRLMDREVGHTGLSELHVVQTMHERKQWMADRADAFIALPGGIGTFEELFEAWTWGQLGYHRKPLGLLNVDGYYDALLAFIDHTVAQGFLSAHQQQTLIVHTDAAALLDAIAVHACTADRQGDYRQI